MYSEGMISSSLSGRLYEHVWNEGRIVVIFDNTNDSTISVANHIVKILSKFYNVNLEPVKTVKQFREISSSRNLINIYVFHGREEGFYVGSKLIDWQIMLDILSRSRSYYHIISICHSREALEDKMKDKPNMKFLPGEVDSEIASIYSVCQVIDIMDDAPYDTYRFFSEKLRYQMIGYVIENLPYLIHKTLYPNNTLGDSLTKFLINVTEGKPLIRGPLGWFVRAVIDNWVAEKISKEMDWYEVVNIGDGSQIQVNIPAVQQGVLAVTEIKKIDLGLGDLITGLFPFDIPLNVTVHPKLGKGPWYSPDYLELVVSAIPEKNALDFAETPIENLLKFGGVEVDFEIKPKLHSTVRFYNFLKSIEEKGASDGDVQVMDMGFVLPFYLNFSIPLSTFLNYIIPGTGTAMAEILEILGIKAKILTSIGLMNGIEYDVDKESSNEFVNLKIAVSLLIDLKIGVGSIIEEIIGVSLPVDFVTLQTKLKGTTGTTIKSKFTSEGDEYSAKLFYSVLFKFYAKIFWFLKFSWKHKWKDDHTFFEKKPQEEQTEKHSNLDFDKDGIWDQKELALNLDSTKKDSDGDGLSDGNEIFEFFTNPRLPDSDGDGLQDGNEIALFYDLGLDPFADYDGDGLSCVIDYDSDNDGLSDREEIEGIYSEYWQKTIKTDPSLPDTDFDGLMDGEEFYNWPHMKPHTDPLDNDTDDDGLKDGFEYRYYLEQGVPQLETIYYLLDSDSDNDTLLDGEEIVYGTDPLDMDTDGDYDLNNNGIIDPDEVLISDGIEGDLSDGGEIRGNYWPGGPFAGRPCQYPWPVSTNPLSKDTDGDGIPDNEEWLNKTNPVYIDSDGDGLSNEEEYNIYDTDCTDNDTDDDGIPDGFELIYFKEERGLTDVNLLSLYLNDNDVDSDGLLDGEELKLGTDVLDADTDKDGITDGREVMYTYTDPLDNDTDDDGIPDGEEVYNYGTNPKRKDTDNDGLSDDIEIHPNELDLPLIGEVTFVTDPLDPDTDDDSIPDGEEVYGWRWAISLEVPSGSNEIMLPIEKIGNRIKLAIRYEFPDPYRARFQTNPANPDTDGDGLKDGEEKLLVLSPLTNDTDLDGIPDFDEINMMQERFGESSWIALPDIWHYPDYDHDGLDDLEEIKYGTDILRNDTDMDGLTDWQEVHVPVMLLNNSTMLYTDALDNDSDDDGVSDYDELVKFGTNPLDDDTDGDGISDYDEIYTYSTCIYDPFKGAFNLSLDPLDNDTDNDGIDDYEELIYFMNRDDLEPDKYYGPMEDYDGDLYPNILDPDSDQDGIYDGVEINVYTNSSKWSWYPLGTDPLDPDQDGNGEKDGYQTDYDQDNLSDYREIYEIVPGYGAPGINKVDAEGYGMIINHTIFALKDTDRDGWNDGDEILVYGTDPLDPNDNPSVAEKGTGKEKGTPDLSFAFALLLLVACTLIYKRKKR